MGFLWIQSMFNVDTKNALFCVTFIQNYASAPPKRAFRRGHFFSLQTGRGLCCVDSPEQKSTSDRDCFFRSNCTNQDAENCYPEGYSPRNAVYAALESRRFALRGLPCFGCSDALR